MSTAASTPAARATVFGPSALLTPANAISGARLLVTPLLLWAVLVHRVSWATWGFWALLCVTDGIDGYLARRYGATRSGAFLDPLADKVLVLGAMVALVVVGSFGWFPVILIGIREFAMSAYRFRIGRRGVSVPAKPLAKVKTNVQEIAVGLALAPLTARHPALVTASLWAAVALTVASGLQYAQQGRRLSASVPAGR